MMEDFERRLWAVERMLDRLRQHGIEHEITGSDPLRPSVMNAGTRLARHKEINFGTGIYAVANPGEKRIDVTLAPTVIEQRCTANTTTSGTTETDLTGATVTITPAIASAALVFGVFRVASHTVDGDQFLGLLDVDGTNEGAAAVIMVNANNVGHQTFTQVWLVPLTAAAHTLKLQGVRNSGTGTITFGSVSSKLVVIIVDSVNATNDASS